MKTFVWFISLRSLLFRIVDVCILKPVRSAGGAITVYCVTNIQATRPKLLSELVKTREDKYTLVMQKKKKLML